MGFGDLKSDSGVKALNDFLQDRSYIEGYQPSQADSIVLGALSGAPKAEYFHALRWYTHINSYGSEKTSFPGSKKAVDQYGPSAKAAPAKPAKDEDDDSDDLFGSDGDDDDEAAELEKERKLAEEAARAKKKKNAPIAKSTILFDVKGYSDETDWVAIEKDIRGIEQEGLRWGASQLKPVAFGIQKLVINCVVVDDQCSVQGLQDTIEEMEEVQSVDIAAFNKI